MRRVVWAQSRGPTAEHSRRRLTHQLSIEERRRVETEETWTERVITNKLTGSRVVVKIPISALSLVDALQVCRSFERLGGAARLDTEVSFLLTPLLGSRILVLSLSSRIYVSSHLISSHSFIPLPCLIRSRERPTSRKR